jgi:hypothetical protein
VDEDGEKECGTHTLLIRAEEEKEDVWRKWKKCVWEWRRRQVEAVCMRVEEEGSGGSVYESRGGGKWRQSVWEWRRKKWRQCVWE